jgi:phenylpyruvate tautomerase PptA (4-oxalocrotonate tautomerase family)
MDRAIDAGEWMKSSSVSLIGTLLLIKPSNRAGGLSVAQIKIYGVREHLNPVKATLSDVIHSCVVDALQFPSDKRAHRFFPLDPEDFHFPRSATPRYTIIEISMFEGRSTEAKKRLIRLLFERICTGLDRSPNEVEVTITETPRHNWGFRGLPGDEIGLPYKVDV